jgi:hypothetical protein
MTNTEVGSKFKRKWWANPWDPEHMAELCAKDRRNAKSFNHWIVIWMVMYLGATLGMEPLPEGIAATPIWRLLLAFSPIVSGALLVRAFIRLFSEMKDELLKKVHYEALAGGFLCAFFIGMCFGLSAVIIGASVIAGPVTFFGMLSGYFISLSLLTRKYNV